jgi:hypothetical protein
MSNAVKYIPGLIFLAMASAIGGFDVAFLFVLVLVGAGPAIAVKTAVDALRSRLPRAGTS